MVILNEKQFNRVVVDQKKITHRKIAMKTNLKAFKALKKIPGKNFFDLKSKKKNR